MTATICIYAQWLNSSVFYSQQDLLHWFAELGFAIKNFLLCRVHEKKIIIKESNQDWRGCFEYLYRFLTVLSDSANKSYRNTSVYYQGHF